MNKALLGIVIILFFNILGEVVAHFILPILPGSIIGMLLLFAGLQLKIIKEHWVEPVIRVVMKNLPVLFLAQSVGIITLFDLIKNDIWAIILAVVLSTVGVITCVGLSLNVFSKDERDTK